MGNGKGSQLKRRRRRNLNWSSAKQRSRNLRVLAAKSPQASASAPAATGTCDKKEIVQSAILSTEYIDGVGDGDATGDEWLSLELNLEASKVETLILRDDNQKLKTRMEDAELSLKEKQSKLENLEEEVKNKREELDVLRMQLRWERERGAGQTRSLSQMKTFLEKLYSVARIMMEGLNGSVPPFDEMMGDGEGTGDNVELMEQFFDDLQSRFFEWQGNHQLMHNELARTLKIVEELADQIEGGGGGGSDGNIPAVEFGGVDDGHISLISQKMEDEPCPSETSGGIPTPCPSSPSSPTLNFSKQFVFFPPTPPEEVDSDHDDQDDRLDQDDSQDHEDPQGLSTRRNPSRKCKEVIESYFERASSIISIQQPQQPAPYSQFTFACEDCGDAFCRLAHVGAQLARVENKNVANTAEKVNPATTVKPEAEFAKPLAPAPKTRAKSGSSPKPKRGNRKSRAKKPEQGMSPPQTKPKLEAVESSGVEHKLAGTFRTIVPQEQNKFLLEGISPAKKRRFFCKCGKNYAGWSGLFYHIKMIATSNKFQCGLCPVSFKLRDPLVTHMKESHRVEYSEDRFSCMECRRTFVGTMKEVVAHQKLFHNDGVDEDGYLSA